MMYEIWQFHDVTPIYLQLYNKLQYGILSGNIRSGETIPPIREMANLLHINPNTVLRSYKMVKQTQLITRSKSGTYAVTQDVRYIQHQKQQTVKEICCSYLSRMFELGFNKSDAIQYLQEYCMELKFDNE